jgi:hypothetical protein
MAELSTDIGSKVAGGRPFPPLLVFGETVHRKISVDCASQWMKKLDTARYV